MDLIPTGKEGFLRAVEAGGLTEFALYTCYCCESWKASQGWEYRRKLPGWGLPVKMVTKPVLSWPGAALLQTARVATGSAILTQFREKF